MKSKLIRWLALSGVVLSSCLFMRVVLAAAQPAAAEAATHFSHATFSPPSGWSSVLNGGWMVYTPPDAPTGQTVWIGISPGGESNRDLAEEFAALLASSSHGMTTVEPGTPVNSTDNHGLKMISQLVTLQDAAGLQHRRLYIARRNGGRFEALAFSSSDAEMSKKYVPALKAMVNSMVFDESAVQRPVAPIAANTPPAVTAKPARPAAVAPTAIPPAAIAPTAVTPSTLGPGPGEKIEAKSASQWYPGTVIKVDGDRRLVHWDGYPTSSDSWLTPDRIRPRTVAPAEVVVTVEHPKSLTFPTQLGAPAVGEVLNARAKDGQWYRVIVLKTEGDKRLAHFPGYADKFNEWVAPDAVKPLTAEEAPEASKVHRADGWLAVTKSVGFGGMHLECSYYWFSPDGRIYVGVPPDGVLASDFATLQKLDPKNCGEYQLVGSILTIWKVGGEVETHRCSVVKGGMDGGIIQAAFRLTDGIKMNAKFSFSVSSNFQGVHAAAGGTWTFKDDGTFEHSSFAGTETTATKGFNGAAPGNGTHVGSTLTQGTYTFIGGQLILKDTAGHTETHGVFGVGKPADCYLVVDGAIFNRQ